MGNSVIPSMKRLTELMSKFANVWLYTVVTHTVRHATLIRLSKLGNSRLKIIFVEEKNTKHFKGI